MDIVKRLRSRVLPTLYDATLDVMDEAADEIERLREYIKNWKDTDSAAIMALNQAKEEIERLRKEIKMYQIIIQKLLVEQTSNEIAASLLELGIFIKPKEKQ